MTDTPILTLCAPPPGKMIILVLESGEVRPLNQQWLGDPADPLAALAGAAASQNATLHFVDIQPIEGVPVHLLPRFKDGELVPHVDIEAQTAARVEQAKAALAKRNHVLVNALADSRALPKAWLDWHATLRGIANGSGQELPPEPPHESEA
jgi:hypothetical protein